MAGMEALRVRGVRRRSGSRGPCAHARVCGRAAQRSPFWSKMARWCRSAGRATVAWWMWNEPWPAACSIRVRGVVQGVGFRPFVYRLARANTLAGWVLNGEEGVEIYLEGAEQGLQAFVRHLKAQPPPAASIAEMEVEAGAAGGRERIHDPRERAPRAADGPDFARLAGLRLIACAELFDPARSALRLSLHQLHQLRPALHGRCSRCPTTGPTPR